jgi:hypothetical protein
MVDNLFPVWFTQQRLWFLDQLDPRNAAYNLPRVIRMVGTVNLSALASAIKALVSRHDTLRTVFACNAIDLPVIVLRGNSR